MRAEVSAACLNRVNWDGALIHAGCVQALYAAALEARDHIAEAL